MKQEFHPYIQPIFVDNKLVDETNLPLKFLSLKGIIFVEIGLSKGTVFVKYSPANVNTLNMLAAHPYPKFSLEPPV